MWDRHLDKTVSPARLVFGLGGKRAGAYWAISSTDVSGDESLNVNLTNGTVVIEVDPSTTGDPQSVTVGNTTTVVVAADTSRKGITITNDSDETIYLGFGAAAVMNEGHRLNADGGFISVVDYTGTINAICASGSKNLSFNTFT